MKLKKKLSEPDFELRVSLGIEPGVIRINKFFENPNLSSGSDHQDLWDIGGVKTYTDFGLNTVTKISSSSALDNQIISIYGLDANLNPTPDRGNPEEPQYVTLNGQNKVTLSTPLNTIWRMKNESDTDLDGTIYAYRDTTIASGVPSDLTKVEAAIIDGNNQTLMSQMTIPYGYSGILKNPFIEISRQQAGIVRFNIVEQSFNKTFRVQRSVMLNTTGTSVFNGYGFISNKINQRTRINIYCHESSAAGIGSAGSYELLLIDNNYLT